MLHIFRIILLITLIVHNCTYTRQCTPNNQITNLNNQSNSEETNSKLKKVVRILSLDGGGTRGYVQVKFLDKLCKKHNIKYITKYFDLIAGTSIGALNAALLANGMTPEDIMKFFRKISPWIFTIRSIKDILSNNASIPSNKPNLIQKSLLIAFKSPFYKAVSKNSNYGDARLRNELTKIFGDRLLTSLKVPVLFTAYNDSEYHPMVFTNIKLHGIPNTFINVKIVDALMASMSAPFYFPSTALYVSTDKKAPSQKIVDGALFQNNPSLLAFTVTRALYPSSEKYFILNLGVGLKKIGLHLDIDDPEPSNSEAAKYNRLYITTMSNASLINDMFFKVNSTFPTNSNMFYYCFNFNLDSNQDCNIDTSTSDFFDYLDDEVEKQYEKDNQKIKEFITSIKNDNSK